MKYNDLLDQYMQEMTELQRERVLTVLQHLWASKRTVEDVGWGVKHLVDEWEHEQMPPSCDRHGEFSPLLDCCPWSHADVVAVFDGRPL